MHQGDAGATSPGLGGHAGCAGEVRCQELPGPVQCIGRFVEDRVEILEDVRHLGGQVEGDRDVGGGGLLREADGVVQEDLAAPMPAPAAAAAVR